MPALDRVLRITPSGFCGSLWVPLAWYAAWYWLSNRLVSRLLEALLLVESLELTLSVELVSLLE